MAMTTTPMDSEEPLKSPVQTKRKRSFDAHEAEEHTHRIADATNLVHRPNKRKQLRIEIPSFPVLRIPDMNSGDHTEVEDDSAGLSAISGLSYDSLFDEVDTLNSECTSTTATSSIVSSLPERTQRGVDIYPALLTAPCIPGLFFDPSILLPQELAESVSSFCMNEYFQTAGVNQVMLFGRLSPSDSSPKTSSTSGLPPVLLNLLSHLSTVLRPMLPDETYDLLFPDAPTQARQAIINLYQPGEGITPHVDLLGRYADGIIGVSFGSGCVMRLDHVGSPTEAGSPSSIPTISTKEKGKGGERDRCDVYLPESSVIVLSEDARYKWTHGIDKCTEDYISLPESDSDSGAKPGTNNASDTLPSGRWLERGIRLSVTFRWLLPGADVVGDS